MVTHYIHTNPFFPYSKQVFCGGEGWWYCFSKNCFTIGDMVLKYYFTYYCLALA